MTKSIIIEFKKVAGRIVAYPVCETALLFCAYNVQPTKSITPNQLEIIKKLGYTIRYIGPNNTYEELK